MKLDVSHEFFKRIDKKHQIPKTLKGSISAKRGGAFSARKLRRKYFDLTQVFSNDFVKR